jgi:hypothetical protein
MVSVVVARSVERAYVPLIGVKRTKSVLDAAELVLAGTRGAWEVQEVRTPDGRLYMRRHFISTRFESPQVWVHEILLPDTDRDPHDHPWDYKTTLLRGSYDEEVNGQVAHYSEGDVLLRRAESLHRLHLASPVVTLFGAAKRRRQWGFATSAGWVESSIYLAQLAQAEPAPIARTQW